MKVILSGKCTYAWVNTPNNLLPFANTLINEHCIVPKDLSKHFFFFSALKKSIDKFDCLVHEILLIGELVFMTNGTIITTRGHAGDVIRVSDGA